MECAVNCTTCNRLARHLNAKIINEGEIYTRRLNIVTFCARSIHNMVQHFKPGSSLVTSGDRSDVIVSAVCLQMNGVVGRIAADWWLPS